MPRKKIIHPPLDPSASVLCLQCDEQLIPLRKPHLYCSIACGQEAEIVRYIRRCTADGRLDQDDVQFAVKTRLAHITAGGYDKNARKLSKEQRQDVVAKFNGLCALCEKDGIEIDHVSGPSGEATNLQLLCKDCHAQKTFQSIVPVSPDSESYDHVKVVHDRIWASAQASTPGRPCQDEKTWELNWRSYRKERAFCVIRD